MSGIDVGRPSTWIPYRSGLCEGCWSGCCTLPVEVSVMDLVRLGVATEDEAAAGLKKLARRLEKDGVVQHFNSRSQIFTLEQRHGRDCIYLHPQTRLCTVYEKRPEVCRKFPKIGPRPGWCPAKRKAGEKEVKARPARAKARPARAKARPAAAKGRP